MIEARRTGTLARWFLRRDRWMLPCWIAGNAVLYVSQAVSIKRLYNTQEEFDRAAAKMATNTAFIAMAGPARALNTVGGQVTWQASAFGSVVAGLMSMFLIGRHTRAEEESGRDELVRAGTVGRHAPLVAAGAVALVANVLLGLAIALSLVAYRLSAAGAFALGVGAALSGLVFTGIAMLAAQLTQSTRAMYGITGAVIAVAYALRAIGDVGNGVLSWLSPIGWGQAMHAYSGERWWPAALSAAAATSLAIAAFTVFDRRDIGAGLWADRPGRPAAGRLLSRLAGLTWRLQRAGIAGWSVGMFLGGLAYGSIGNDVGDLIGDTETTRDIFAQGGGSLVDAFFATAMVMLALIGCGFTIASAIRPSREEAGGYAEVLLATAASRRRWMGSHLAVTVGGTLLVVVSAGLGIGAGYGLVTRDAAALGRFAGAMLAQTAAMLVFAGTATLLYGLHRRWASGAWILLVFSTVVLLFSELWRMPRWIVEISPFSHLALQPAQPFRLAPLVALLAIAAALSAAGFAAFHRRDIG